MARPIHRRRFVSGISSGLAGIALAALSQESVRGDSPEIDPAHPHRPRQPHYRARATQVIEIFCSGALSHIDTFDYKPELIRHHGQPLPGNHRLVSFQGPNGNLTQPLWKFRPRGECGKRVSDLLPEIGKCVDDICFVHSLTNKSNTHGPAENVLNTGFAFDGFPSMGAWINFALGSENENLPAFVAIEDPRGMPQSGPNNWASGFLPAAFQGTPLSSTRPIRYLDRPASIAPEADSSARQALRFLEQKNQTRFPGDAELAARISSYELSGRMQLSVPGVAKLGRRAGICSSTLWRGQCGTKPRRPSPKTASSPVVWWRPAFRFVQLFNGAYAPAEESIGTPTAKSSLSTTSTVRSWINPWRDFA